MNLENLKDLIDEHEGGGFKKIGWFSLKNDGDEQVVRLLREGITKEGKVDLPIYEVHRVEEIGMYGRNVKCLEDDCPLCKTGHPRRLRMFLPIYIEGGDPEIQIWERGIVDIKKLLAMHSEYGTLNERDFKIKRTGKKGDPKTTYEFFPRDKEDKELPEVKEEEIVNKTSFYLLDLPRELLELASEGRLTEDIIMENANGTQEEVVSNLDGFEAVNNEDIPF